VAEAAATVTPDATAVLDIGCGAGNYTLRLLKDLPGLSCTLIDLSRPMLDRAFERVSAATAGAVATLQGDIRDQILGEGQFDIVLGAAVFHHLRTNDEWRTVFEKIYRCLRPGGSFWITDLITHTTPAIQSLMWRRYGEYLAALKDDAYRDHVFAYIEKEDTPRPILFQIDLLRAVGFRDVELLHKNSCFAAFGGVK
jgi:tRNA (cmo5U34)-methyltransferase